jgi:8-oxo-dGTP diphosphatase
MSRRFQTGYEDGNYSLVAGHVDGEEIFREAMAREAKEEAGITLNVDDLSLALTMHRKADDERLSLFFEATTWSGDLRNMEPIKCGDLSWFLVNELPSNTVPYIAAALRSVQASHRYAEFGW